MPIFSKNFIFCYKMQSSLLPRAFDKKLFAMLVAAFVFATIIGTLSHEFGHYIVARVLGQRASIHYAYANNHGPEMDSIYSIYIRYEKEIESDSPFPEKERF